MNQNVKIIKTWWTSSVVPNMNLGFVLTEGVTGVRKLYCGTYEGKDISKDVESIISSVGAPLREPVLKEMLRKLTEKGKFK